MKLIWVRNLNPALVGQEVKVGHEGQTFRGESVVVEHFRPPHSPSSEGKMTVRQIVGNLTVEYYVGVIGAAWVDREDQ